MRIRWVGCCTAELESQAEAQKLEGGSRAEPEAESALIWLDSGVPSEPGLVAHASLTVKRVACGETRAIWAQRHLLCVQTLDVRELLPLSSICLPRPLSRMMDFRTEAARVLPTADGCGWLRHLEAAPIAPLQQKWQPTTTPSFGREVQVGPSHISKRVASARC